MLYSSIFTLLLACGSEDPKNEAPPAEAPKTELKEDAKPEEAAVVAEKPAAQAPPHRHHRQLNTHPHTRRR